MTLYGPLTAQDFLRLLDGLSRENPRRPFFEAVLDALIATLDAERCLLVRLRPDGGFRVVFSRNHDGESIRDAHECVSQFALQRAMETGEGVHVTNSAQRDRRYRTEGVARGQRPPRSILVLRLAHGSEPHTVVYLDHRFQEMEYGEHQRISCRHWLVLLDLAFRLRDQGRRIARLEKSRVTSIRDPEAPRAGGDPPPLRPVASRECPGGLWTCSPTFVELLDSVERVARSDIPVIVQGETGAGKGLVARTLHEASARRNGPFVVLDCGAIPDNLIESELFGHTRGSYTGAESERVGLLTEADGGTLFLDEIADMSPGLQRKLLRFLEEGRFRRLGEKTEARADVRVVSATRMDLEEEVQEGRFRSDLFYRLSGIRLRVPPLREHPEDIVCLAERFLRRFTTDLDDGGEVPLLTDSARDWMLRYSWPGNVRELENCMRQLVTLGSSRIEADHLDSILGRSRLAASRVRTIEEVVARAERRAVVDALGRSAGNKSRAAELLGITRKSLYRRLSKYGLVDAVDSVTGRLDDREGREEIGP